jgi:hypothetical protein
MTKSANFKSSSTVGLGNHSRVVINPVNIGTGIEDSRGTAVTFSHKFKPKDEGLGREEIMNLRRNYTQANRK